MIDPVFHDEQTIAETAEMLGKQALQRGLIPSFTVHHFPDTKQFLIPTVQANEPLTPEQAYLHLKRLLGEPN